jgi:hypothetical protein
MNAYETTYFATRKGKFYKDLPMSHNNIAQAATWLNKQEAGDVQIFERFKVLDSNGNIVSKPHEVTSQCVDILMDYYNGY